MLLLVLLLSLPLVSWQTANCAALWQLDSLAQCRLQRSYQNYQNYGCACSNIDVRKPIDDIDRCCAVHSACYSNLTVHGGSCQNPDAANLCTYGWTCSNQQIVCYHNSACMQAVCTCDKELIDCLGQYPYPSYPKKCPIVRADRHLTVANATLNALAEQIKNQLAGLLGRN